MHKVCLFGAGKIGEAICCLLAPTGRYELHLCDVDGERAKTIAGVWPNTTAHTLDLNNETATLQYLKGCDAVLSALPFFCNPKVATYAAKAGCHYLDLTEDVATTDKVSEIAKGAKTAFMPQCGLAPGFISVAAAHLMRLFEKVDTVKMRVGALPIYPSNRLKYNLTWSTEGLINECGNMCEVLDHGQKRLAFALEGHEHFSLDGVEYEAFNTSGGLGTLCDTLEGKVRSLDYKSIRYPGHRELMVFLMNELGFNEERETLRHIFEKNIPSTNQDKVIILVEVIGQKGGKLVQKTYASTIYNEVINKKHLGAIQITTAAGICAPLDLLLNGKLKSKSGFLHCEDISLIDFLGNEFGRYYRDERALSSIAN